MAVKRMDNIFIVVSDLTATIALFHVLGLELVGEVVRNQDACRLRYIRGPEELLVGLAQELS